MRQNLKYRFTADWTSPNFANWERWFGHFRNEPTYMLEIGSFEGRSAIWWVENILTHPESELICVDAWRNQNFHDNMKRFDGRSKIWAVEGTSDWLKDHNPGFFDLVYIDGDHSAEWVLKDVTNVEPFVKDGGFILFDDYATFPGVKEAVGVFIDRHPDFGVVEFSHQILLRRKAPQVSVTSAEGNTAPGSGTVANVIPAPGDDPHCSECHAAWVFGLDGDSFLVHYPGCSLKPTAMESDGTEGE